MEGIRAFGTGGVEHELNHGHGEHKAPELHVCNCGDKIIYGDSVLFFSHYSLANGLSVCFTTSSI